MGLIGRLSNSLTTSNLQCLTSRDWHKARKQLQSANGPQPDGRRPFRSVSQLIIQVLAEAGSELRVRDIHTRVEQLLSEAVSRGSVKNYFHKGSRRCVPLFEYRGRRGYRLARLDMAGDD
jgi:hypothetical protein